MTEAVQVVMVTTSEMTVSWYPYSAADDSADGALSPRPVVVSSYDVEMTTDDHEWTLVGNVSASTQLDQHSQYR